MNIPFTLKQRKAVISVLIIFAILVAATVAITIGLNFAEKSVTFETHDVTVTYGEKPDLSDFSIMVENTYGTVKKRAVEADDVTYNPETIGTQTATVNYKNKQQTFKITINAKKLDTPNVKITNGVVEWTEIAGAGTYKVSIDDVSYSVTANRYDLSELPKTGTLTITVQAMPALGDNRYILSEISQSVTLTKLNSISNLQYANGEFTWGAVEGAIGYNVTVNGNSAQVTENKYPFTNFVAGKNECVVYALGDDYHWSGDRVSLTLTKLAPAANITYDWNTGRIVWEHADEDVGFNVFVNDEKVSETYNRFAEYEFKPSVNYKVTITVTRDAALPSEPASKVLTVTKLDEPSLTVANGILSWSAVSNAAKYEIYTDGTVRTQSVCSFSVSELSAGEHEIKVRSFSDGGLFMSSEYSVMTFTKLSDVTNLAYSQSDSLFSWTAVSGAAKYEITINGINYQTMTNEYKFEGNFVEGANNISVNAVSQSDKVLVGEKAALVLYKLRKVRNVVFSGRYLTWEDDNAGCLYKIEVGDKNYTSNEKRLELTLDKRTFIRITAYSEASNTLQSEVFEDSFTTMTLATPVVKIAPNTYYAGAYDISVNPVPGATAYNVTVYLYADANGSTPLVRTFTLSGENLEREIDASGKNKICVEVVAVDDTGNYNYSAIGKAELTINK